MKTGSVIELIGPAGSGKTTVVNELKKASPVFCQENLPPVWQPAYIPFYFRNVLSVPLSLYLFEMNGDRRISRRELAWMAILNGWSRILENRVHNQAGTIILDQGPVFLMAILSGFGPKGLQHSRIDDWWQRTYHQWANLIDCVIWLDARDDILTRRIRNRPSNHLVKGDSDQKIQQFILSYRKIYERILNTITVIKPGICVMRIDTGVLPVVGVVQTILDQLNLTSTR